MCDIIEITTRPKERPVYYPATSSAFEVDIKGLGTITISLASHSLDYLQINISDGRNDEGTRYHYVEYEFEGYPMRQVIPEIFDDDCYRSFWLTWNSGEVRFGRKGETTPIFTQGQLYLAPVKYISFCGDSANETRWRFLLPPVIERPRTFHIISGGKPSWKRAIPCRLPNNVIIGGFENEPLYIIRAFHEGELGVGKFVPSERAAYVTMGKESYKKEVFNVLCGFNYQWVPIKKSMIPANAVKGGYIEDSHEIFYVGRAYHDGHLIPGKVLYRHKCCYIPYNGEAIAKQDYEVLTVPKEKKHFIKKPSYFAHFTVCSSNLDQNEEESDVEDYREREMREHEREVSGEENESDEEDQSDEEH